MASLQEILAAKKAQKAGIVPVQTVDDQVVDVEAKLLEEKEAKLVEKSAAENHAEDVKETIGLMAKPDPQTLQKEEPAVAAPKALSFAEKMALRRKEEHKQEQSEVLLRDLENANRGVYKDAQAARLVEEKPAPTPAKEDTGTTSSIVASLSQDHESDEDKLRTGVLDATIDKNPMPLPEAIKPEDSVDPEIAQAYADIKSRIDQLNEKAGIDLEGAMKELKKALMQNPAAVSLMEDTDIGQLVIALRKIVGEAVTEAAKESKNGNGGGRAKKLKQIDLSDPAAVASIFDEL